MSSTGEDDHSFFPQKFSYSDYLFVYTDGNNNVVDLIHTTPDSADTPEACMPDEDVVDIMGDDMLEAMELKNGKICDDSDYACGGEHEMYYYTYYLSGTPENTRDNIYIYISEPTNGEKHLVKGNNIVCLSWNR